MKEFLFGESDRLTPLRITIRTKLIFVMLIVAPILILDQVYIFKLLIPSGF
jgi:hypothetical protein